jgi:5,5'-dehydrodivanillate O-demethylase
MESTERLELLSRTSPGTPTGSLLRSFWQPVALSKDVAAGKARAIRIMGEDLTLYRGESGRAHLVGQRCAHRLSLLHTGWVEGDRIRCIYHGWQYDGTGQCVERPAEKDTAPPKIRIAGYPVQEYCGLVFAYMGEGPAPDFDLPRKDAFERTGGIAFARAEPWPCNWFQQIENSLDATHVSFVHRIGIVGTFGGAVTQAIPELEYQETDAGIRQIATRGKGNVRISDWTFPNNNHIILPSFTKDDPWVDVGIWVVPVDDAAATRFLIYAVPPATPEVHAKFTRFFEQSGDYNPADHHDELFVRGKYPTDPLVELTSAQDYVAVMGQGAIVDRAQEHLGRSDKGVIFLRRLFWRELEGMRTRGPVKKWRRLEHSVQLPIQTPEPAWPATFS